jgi:hypothetical protein
MHMHNLWLRGSCGCTATAPAAPSSQQLSSVFRAHDQEICKTIQGEQTAAAPAVASSFSSEFRAT